MIAVVIFPRPSYLADDECWIVQTSATGRQWMLQSTLNAYSLASESLKQTVPKSHSFILFACKISKGMVVL